MRTLTFGACALILALAVVTAPAIPAEARGCSGKYEQRAPGAVLTADRLSALQISCREARALVKRFLRRQARSIECAGAAANPGTVCLVGSYECEKRGRASCLNQGYGVTFRQRDRSTG
jgi:hypothetical protein